MNELRETRSTCSYCGVGCGVIITERAGKIVSVRGDKEHPANLGMLCSKGRELHETVHLPNRLLRPMLRADKNSLRNPIEWNDAFALAAKKIQEAISSRGPDSVGFYISGQLLTEDYYVFNKLAKGFVGTNNVDSNSRLCVSSAVVAYKKAFGVDGPPTSYSDIDEADLFFIAGSNTAWCHPIVFRRIEKAWEADPSKKLIVLDPRKSATARVADIHVQLRPGSDLVFITALLAELHRRGQTKAEYIEAYTENFEALATTFPQYTIERVEAECGVSRELFLQVLNTWQDSHVALSMWAMGINQAMNGTVTSSAIINLHLATGHIARPGAGPFSLTGQPNAMGGRETGAMSNLLGAHRELGNEDDRRAFESLWNSGPISPKPGLSAVDLFEAAADGALDVLWIACTNPAVSMPDANAVHAALERTPFVIVQDIVGTTDTAHFADLLLPAAGWGEKAGTVTNSERRITRIKAAISAPGMALPDWQIVCGVAKELGYPEQFGYDSPNEIFAEHAESTRGRDCDVTGATSQRLEVGPVQWPIAEGSEEGTERLYTDGAFPTKSGKAQFVAAEKVLEHETGSDTFPMLLTTGRMRDQWHTMTRTGRVPELMQHAPVPELQISEADANAYDVETGDELVVENDRGEFRMKVEVSDACLPGMLFAPMHWGREFSAASPNAVTSGNYDPFSQQPALKQCAVRVRARNVAQQGRVVIVGAGHAGVACALEIRALDSQREITILGDERARPYNRVRLHEAAAGISTMNEIALADAARLESLNIELRRDSSVFEINRGRSCVTLASGEEIQYSSLVLAMGAAPRKPNITNPSGVYFLRSANDAEKIRGALTSAKRIAIIGAGPLGVELAGEIAEAGHTITLATFADLPLNNQLDRRAGELLLNAIEAKGIGWLPDFALAKFRGEQHVTHAIAEDGREVEADLIICAIGVLPRTEIAAKAGVLCARGVVVDSRMRTNDKNIFAVGDLAEFEGRCVGLVAVSREQSEVAAAAICGDERASFEWTPHITALKFPGLEVRACGSIEEVSDPDQDDIELHDRRRGRYRRIIFNRDRIVGQVAIGPFPGFMEVDKRMRQGLRIGEDREMLLSGAYTAKNKSNDGPMVCACAGVSAGAVIGAISEGANSVENVRKATDAGGQCGSCRPEVAALITRIREKNAADNAQNGKENPKPIEEFAHGFSRP